MSKIDELKHIDDFINEFNKPIYKLGNLQRLTGENQESPDALCRLDNKLLIGLEATIAVLPEDTPLNFKTKNGQRKNFSSEHTIDLLMSRIKSKSLYDYKEADLDEVWLLVIGGSLISRKRLEDRLSKEHFTTRFNRIFIHKGILGADLIELAPHNILVSSKTKKRKSNNRHHTTSTVIPVEIERHS